MAEKAAKKKPNIFVRIGKAITRFFRDTRGEVKKVVWPTRKQTWNNFIIVAIFVVVCALFIFLLDFAFGRLMSLLLNLGA